MVAEELEDIISTLDEIREDPETPKKVKEKLDIVVKELSTNKEISVAAHNAIYELDGIGEKANMQPYIRTQILQIVSMLESL